ncbi:putative PEP-binding protein [Pseudomonas aeruginosa]
MGIERLPELGVDDRGALRRPCSPINWPNTPTSSPSASNDLSQYALAMDRCHAGLADRQRRLSTRRAATDRPDLRRSSRHGRWVGVCGALASDRAGDTGTGRPRGRGNSSVGPNPVGESRPGCASLTPLNAAASAQAPYRGPGQRAGRCATPALHHRPLA